MAIQNWSEKISVIELADDPQFTDDLNVFIEAYSSRPTDVILNFAAVGYINSSNLSKLLRLRKTVMHHHKRLVFCGVNTQVWGVFLVTGLDKIFEFISDVSTALATLQLSSPK